MTALRTNESNNTRNTNTGNQIKPCTTTCAFISVGARSAIGRADMAVLSVRIKKGPLNASLTSARVITSLAEGRAIYHTNTVRGELVAN